MFTLFFALIGTAAAATPLAAIIPGLGAVTKFGENIDLHNKAYGLRDNKSKVVDIELNGKIYYFYPDELRAFKYLIQVKRMDLDQEDKEALGYLVKLSSMRAEFFKDQK